MMSFPRKTPFTEDQVFHTRVVTSAHLFGGHTLTTLHNKQGSANYSLPIAFLLLLIVNKALWEHSHTHLFTYHCWLLSHNKGRGESLWQRPYGSQSLKHLPSDPFQTKFGDHWAREKLITNSLGGETREWELDPENSGDCNPVRKHANAKWDGDITKESEVGEGFAGRSETHWWLEKERSGRICSRGWRMKYVLLWFWQFLFWVMRRSKKVLRWN